MSEFIKGVKESDHSLDGSQLRVLIIHARWNATVVDALVAGTRESLIQRYNVKAENIEQRDVPGAYELPFAAQRLITQSQQQSSDLIANMTDTMNSLMDDIMVSPSPSGQSGDKEGGASTAKAGKAGGPFDAVVCIGVLIKGATQHFEYISDSVSQGLMRVGLETGVPVIFGVLTCLTEEQALERAGLRSDKDKPGHNHGIDWGAAAVEMAMLKL
ncbi:lumazine synthase [Dispira simplex]|nr:lumazine synthase [Dispira simplex]